MARPARVSVFAEAPRGARGPVTKKFGAQGCGRSSPHALLIRQSLEGGGEIEKVDTHDRGMGLATSDQKRTIHPVSALN